jgi:CRISPR-associated protein Csm3
MKFKKNIILKWRVEIKTGLHIGGSKEGVKIGGTDNPVIKTYIKYKENENDEGVLIEMPYIPGSSIKGKMRHLLESSYEGQNDKLNMISKLFGRPAEEKEKEPIVTRLIIRDSYPTKEWIKKLVLEDVYERGLEIKGENKIENNGSANPRFIERVIPGVEFDLEAIITVYEGDDENGFINLLKEGTELLKDSYLGGQGTRGYGKIEIKWLGKEERELEYYEKLIKG